MNSREHELVNEIASAVRRFTGENFESARVIVSTKGAHAMIVAAGSGQGVDITYLTLDAPETPQSEEEGRVAGPFTPEEG